MKDSVQIVKNKRFGVYVLFIFGFLNLATVLLNHYFFRTYAFDYATYNFAFFDYAHFRISPCSMYPAGDGSFFQDHFSLTLFVFIPLYWLLNWLTGLYTLLIIQWACIMAGAWATYKLIELKSTEQYLPILALIYYFTLLGRFNASAADCNFAIIGAAIVPVFIYFFEKGKFVWTLLCWLFLIITREDFSLWLVFICLFLMILYRKEKPKLKLSALLCVTSLLSFLLIFKVIIPAIEDNHRQYSLFNYGALGETPEQCVAFIFKHPLKAFELLFVNHSDSNYYNNVKKEFYLVYLVSGALILFYKPFYLIPFIPLIAKKMYNDSPLRWGVETYYSIEVVSILPIMVFLIIAGFKNKSLRTALSVIICVSTLSVSIIKMTQSREEHIAMMGDKPKTDFLNADFYKSRFEDMKDMQMALKLIPKNAAVSTSGSISPQLASRAKIYFFPRIGDADFVFVIKKGDSWPLPQEEFDAILNKLVVGKEWKIVIEKKEFILLARSNNFNLL